jgi:hypothetical protein
MTLPWVGMDSSFRRVGKGPSQKWLLPEHGVMPSMMPWVRAEIEWTFQPRLEGVRLV